MEFTSPLALGANARKLGANSICWNRSKSVSIEIFSTFNSSAKIPWNSAKSGPDTIQPSPHGNLCRRDASTRIRRPVSASSLTNAILASSAKSCGGRVAVALAASSSHESAVAPSRLPGVPSGQLA